MALVMLLGPWITLVAFGLALANLAVDDEGRDD